MKSKNSFVNAYFKLATQAALFTALIAQAEVKKDPIIMPGLGESEELPTPLPMDPSIDAQLEEKPKVEFNEKNTAEVLSPAPPISLKEELPEPEIAEPKITNAPSATDDPNKQNLFGDDQRANPKDSMQKQLEHAPSESKLSNKEQIMSSPTRSVEDYEKTRKELFHKEMLPKWALGLQLMPKPFKSVDYRVRPRSGSDSKNARMYGFGISGERVLINRVGMLSAGAEANLYFSRERGDFSGMLPAPLYSLSPYAMYQFVYLNNQWIVPTARWGYEFLRYNYEFQGKTIKGSKSMPRWEIGAMLYLNFLDKSTAGEAQFNWGIKKTYLGVFYYNTVDNGRTDFDLSERGVRFGIRFEI